MEGLPEKGADIILAMSLTVSLQNDVWGTNEEIPYRWRVTKQIRFVILIGWSKFPTRHE